MPQNEVMTALAILHQDMKERFDKLEGKFDTHVREDAEHFDQLGDDVKDAKDAVDGARKLARWSLGTLITALVTWLFTKV